MLTGGHSRLPGALKTACMVMLTGERSRLLLLLALSTAILLCRRVVVARGLHQAEAWGVLCSGVIKSDAT